MTENLTDRKLGIIGTTSALLASIFLSPEKAMVPAACSVLAIAGSFLLLKGRWVQSKADEWLLVIRDGKLVKAGIGLKTFIGFTDNIVKFPSKIQQVDFTANNVTKEMQGVQITGFAFWSVYRQDDGPFRCYKYMESDNANANVQAMCESVLRSQIANSSLNDVLRNRNTLRDAIKEELKDQFKGWGVWLQTVQITEVKISSSKLFQDLQAQFRQSTHLKASQIELSSKERISEVRQSINMKLSDLTQNVKTQKQTMQNSQNLKRKQVQSNFEAKKNELEVKKMQREKKLQLEKLKNDFTNSKLKQQNEQELEKLKQEFNNKQTEKMFELNKLHTELTLEKYEIDSMERVYRNLSMRNMSINQFSGGDKQSIGAILPALGYGAAQLRSGTN